MEPGNLSYVRTLIVIWNLNISEEAFQTFVAEMPSNIIAMPMVEVHKLLLPYEELTIALKFKTPKQKEVLQEEQTISPKADQITKSKERHGNGHRKARRLPRREKASVA